MRISKISIDMGSGIVHCRSGNIYLKRRKLILPVLQANGLAVKSAQACSALLQVQPRWPESSFHRHVWRSKMVEGKSSRSQQWLVLLCRSLCWYFWPFQKIFRCASISWIPLCGQWHNLGRQFFQFFEGQRPSITQLRSKVSIYRQCIFHIDISNTPFQVERCQVREKIWPSLVCAIIPSSG